MDDHQAEPELRALYAHLIRWLGRDHPLTIACLESRANALTGLGRQEDAQREFAAVLDNRDHSPEPQERDPAGTHHQRPYLLTSLAWTRPIPNWGQRSSSTDTVTGRSIRSRCPVTTLRHADDDQGGAA